MIEAGQRSKLFFLCPALLAMVFLIQGIAPAAAQEITKSWAIAEFGEPLYKDGFEHWPYANPDAPKGGKIVLGTIGSFDTFNPYILKGEFPGSIGLIYDSLTVGSGDEIMASYGVIAETMEYPEDKSWIIFNMRPEARFTDGVPIVAADICYTLDIYKTHGRPLLKSFVADLESCEVLGDHRVKFNVKTRGIMKPLTIAAGMGPSPRHYWEEHDITKTSLVPPPGSGAYRIKDFEAGRSITFERVEDYWGADLPVNRGLNNFDIIRYEYYKDETVLFEAFKAGEIDYRTENSAKRWVQEYDFPAVKKQQVKIDTIPENTPRGLGGYFFNMKRPQFKDARVREGIVQLYDFETLRRTLLFDKYRRVESYFPNSQFGSSGAPSEAVIALLEPYKDQLKPEVLSKPFALPKTDGSGRDRKNLRTALKLFKEAGYELKGGKLIKSDTGEQLKFEILTANPETKRLAGPFIARLKKAGIDAALRFMDVAQWRSRLEQGDYDVYTARNNFFPPPGTELQIYFGTEREGQPGSGNRSGYSHPVVDKLIRMVAEAQDLETLVTATRALDRIVLWDHIVVPTYYPDEQWFAYWDRFGKPETRPKYSTGFPGSWWIDPERDKKLAQR